MSGPILTDSSRWSPSVREWTPEAFAKQLLGTLGAATGRITTPEEVAAVVAFAAAPNNLTGTEIILDGGTVKS